MQGNKINVAVVGVGYWGPNYVRNLLEIEEVGKIFVCDQDSKRLAFIKNKYPQIEITSSFQMILENPNIAAVFVVTPANRHFEIAKPALLVNKHVFVEKPMAQNSSECKVLVGLAEEKNRALMVGHLLEYKSSIRKIREIILKGEIGDVLYLDASRLNLGLIRSDVSVLWDSAVHDIYTCNFILSKYPKRVSASGAKYFEYTKTNLESIAFLTLDYGDNILVHIHINWLSPLKSRKMTICGTKKMLAYDDIDLIEPLKIYDRGVGIVDENDSHSYRMGDTIIPKIDTKEPLKVECEHFINCILDQKKPQSDGVVGLNTVKIVEAAEESIKSQSKFIDIKYDDLPTL